MRLLARIACRSLDVSAGPMAEVGVDEILDVSVKNFVRMGRFQFGPFVAHQLVRIQDVGSYLVSEGDFALVAV